MTNETDEALAIEYLGSKQSDSDGVVKFTYVKPGSDRETECINALCRLLRSREEISIGLRWRLATLFDREAPVEARQLVFKRRRRGGPNEPSDARWLAIAIAMAAEIKADHGLESAIAAAVKRYGVDRSTVLRAWRKHKGGPLCR